MVIYKYHIEIRDRQTVAMPQGADPLDVQLQGDKLYLWALVDSTKPMEDVPVSVFGTGNPIPPGALVDAGYFATVQQGPYV